MALMAWLLAVSLALGAPSEVGGFYVESASLPERAQAVEVVQIAIELGLRAQVERRYRHGVGREHVAVVEGFESREEATEAARRLHERTGHRITVYAVVDQPPEVPAADPDDEAAPAADGGASADSLLKRAVRAHGGRRGGAEVLARARAVLVRYRRQLPSGLVALHTWARRGEDRYLQVEVESGPGVSSRILVREGQAWLWVEDGQPETVEAARAEEVIERLALERIMASSLGFAGATRRRPELDLLYLDGVDEVEEVPCHLLRYSGDGLSGPLTVALDVQSYLVRRVVLGTDSGELVQDYSDYRDVTGDLVVPHHFRSSRDGANLDQVRVLEIDVEPRLPEEWFALPPG